MNANEVVIGMKVEKIGTDYTGGRRGEVVEINPEQTRARVKWTHERSGSPVSAAGKNLKDGIRTWCAFKSIKAI